MTNSEAAPSAPTDAPDAPRLDARRAGQGHPGRLGRQPRRVVRLVRLLAFTLYFAKHFFPKGDQTAQLLQAAAVFFLGFLARPIGAWLMGIYADHAGRRAALTLGGPDVRRAPSPSPSSPTTRPSACGPAILLLARVVQGLSVGGEYGASATYMSEMAGKNRRGFWSSFQFVTLIMGQLPRSAC
jgi:MHS family alpha-ketoglutarate permease-like MFS transporter